MSAFKVDESSDSCTVTLSDGQKLELFTDGDGLHIQADHRLAVTTSHYSNGLGMLIFIAIDTTGPAT